MQNNQLIKSSNIKDVVSSEAVKARLREIMGDRGAGFGAALVQIVKQSEQLQKCDANSVIGAALTAAALDLSVDPNLGEAHIIPYGDQAQFQIGFKGFIQLAMRSGEYKAFGSTIVHDGELVKYDELTGELEVDKAKRKPDAKIVGYAAKFKLLNGFERGEFWTCAEIEAHALAYSKQYRYAKDKPDKHRTCLWITKRDEMAIKTVEKSLLNHYGPKSIQMKKAIVMDGGAIIDADTGELNYIDNTDVPRTTSPQFSESTVDAGQPSEPPPAAPVQPVAKPEPVKATPSTIKGKEAPATTKRPVGVPPENIPVRKMRERIADAGVTVEKILDFMITLGTIESNTSSIEQLHANHIEVFQMLDEQFDDIINRVKGE
jgi:recombination protein RecT